MRARILGRAVSGISLSVEDRIAENGHRGIILILLIADHDSATDVVVYECHVGEGRGKSTIVGHDTPFYALIGCEVRSLHAQGLLREALLVDEYYGTPSLDGVRGVPPEALLTSRFPAIMPRDNIPSIASAAHMVV